MQQEFTFQIQNERYEYVKVFSLSLLILNTIALFYVGLAFTKNDALLWAILCLIAVIAWFFKMQPKYPQFNILGIGAFWAIMGWSFMHQFWVAIVLLLLMVMGSFIRKRFVFTFDSQCISINTFPPTIFKWHQLNNVILRDGILTVDFRNNKLLQGEIINTTNNYISEQEFNEFCRLMLNNVQPAL
jgi:hypothetical protein